ncbi:hypothetical protein EK21DRAFT_85861 [Setomelanomma holmii]|uniref:Heterokaryon incompatibility domain-containing protein n=1 Tax=Setomelanomma holmii TaxID=210430 RepID=A0A9P4LNN7_9PLEO|nr:hypothetical protein EK21DRAFT_85861 [Setomelanomma holmii]
MSADHSENSHGRLFKNRLAYKFSQCSLTIPIVGNVHILPQSDFRSPVTQSPISERAWVTREQYLSLRVLHFTSDQMFWECGNLYACETFPRSMPDIYGHAFQPYRALEDSAGTNDSAVLDHRRIWGRMCEDYSAAKLTYPSDQPIAFSGMAKDFRSRRPDDKYLAGMWEEDLVYSLIWSVRALDGCPFQPNGSRDEDADPFITASLPPQYRAPSWSWLSKDCSIFWSKIRLDSQPLLEISSASVDLVDENDPTRDMWGSSITVRGSLRAASWHRYGDTDTDMIVLGGKSGQYLQDALSDTTAPSTDMFMMQRDVGDEFPTKNIFLLPVRQSSHAWAVMRGLGVIDGLKLGRKGGEDQYERLGYFEATGKSFCRALAWQLEMICVRAGISLAWSRYRIGRVYVRPVCAERILQWTWSQQVYNHLNGDKLESRYPKLSTQRDHPRPPSQQVFISSNYNEFNLSAKQ